LITTAATVVTIASPPWIAEVVDWDGRYQSDAERMAVAVTLAQENVRRGTGGPFGAAIFQAGGRLVAVGVNSVVPAANSVLHAEMMAFMLAEHRLGSFTLEAEGMPAHELFTSCEPCAMCLGATLWSGVRRVVTAAAREDAARLGFEEGPVFPESYAYLEARGVRFTRDVLRAEARAVLEAYREQGGPVYNG
jgi:tRNA(Arg) A34 adenosine deaminase TadA